MSDLKVVMLPIREEMIERLNKVSDESHLQQKFYPLLLKYAGEQKAGMGVVMMLQLAIQEYTEGLPPMIANLLQMRIKEFIEALVDDEEVRKDAFEMIDAVNDAVNEKFEEEKVQNPTPPRKILSEEEANELFSRIKQLAAVYDEYAMKYKYNQSEEYRKGGANPFYSQTIDGLYLEFYYGAPSKVWTPWGYWYFAAADLSKDDLDAFMARLSVRDHIPEHNTAAGTIGPVYAILAIDSVDLPDPTLPTDSRQYIEYDEANNTWKKLEENYNSNRGAE